MRDATAPPAGRVSRGCISKGYSHPRGPQDQAYAESKSRMNAMMYQPSQVGAGVIRAREMAMTIRAMSIWNPACRSQGYTAQVSEESKIQLIRKTKKLSRRAEW